MNALTFLRDVGMFRDRFQQEVLEKDVMPWLFDQTCTLVADMDAHNAYPRTLIGNYMETAQEKHANEVKAYAARIKAKREAEKKGEEDKITERLSRK